MLCVHGGTPSIETSLIFCNNQAPLCETSNNIIFNIIEPPHDKTNKMTVPPAKTQISLGIRPVRSESSLCAQWVAKDPSFLHADSEDSDPTGYTG